MTEWIIVISCDSERKRHHCPSCCLMQLPFAFIVVNMNSVTVTHLKWYIWYSFAGNCWLYIFVTCFWQESEKPQMPAVTNRKSRRLANKLVPYVMCFHSLYVFTWPQWTAEGSVFGTVCDFFVCVWNISGTAEWICAKFTWKSCLVPHSDEFAGQGQSHQGQKTAFLGPFSGLYTACLVKRL